MPQTKRHSSGSIAEERAGSMEEQEQGVECCDHILGVMTAGILGLTASVTAHMRPQALHRSGLSISVTQGESVHEAPPPLSEDS